MNETNIKSVRMSEGIIIVRPYSGTYIARFRGKTASCTSGPKAAAQAVAGKVMGATSYIIKMCGNDTAWQVLSFFPEFTLPCPFCGGKAKVKCNPPAHPEIQNRWWSVTCARDTRYYHKRGIECPVTLIATGDTRDEAVANWNARK